MISWKYIIAFALFSPSILGDMLDDTESGANEDETIVIGEQPPPSTNGTDQDERAYLRCACGRNAWGFDEVPESNNSTDDERIVGGFRITNAYDPWMAQIIRLNRFVCSGSVLSDRYVLTAAHCLYSSSYFGGRFPYPPSYFKVKLGATLLNEPGQVFTVSSHTMLSYYYNNRRNGNFQNRVGDWALLRVSRTIPITSGIIRPICISTVLTSRMLNGRTNARITGWGAESTRSGASVHLKQGYSQILEPNTCSRVSRPYYSTPRAGEVCGRPIYRHGICFGDSGGPLSYDIFGKDYVIGVASYIYTPCETSTRRPNVFADVTTWRLLIRSIVMRGSNVCR